jgi:hypothetical protein
MLLGDPLILSVKLQTQNSIPLKTYISGLRAVDETAAWYFIR